MQSKASEKYFSTLKAFSKELKVCIRLSHQCEGIRSPSSRHTYAAILFTAICTRAMSLGMMTPENEWTTRSIDHWDYVGMFGLARGIIEMRLAFYYLCTEDCRRSEWGLRWHLFNLHDCCSRAKLFEQIDRSQIPEFEKQAVDLRSRIQANRFYQRNELQLTEKQQRELLSGKKCYLYPAEEIAERAGMGKTSYQLYWQLFSNSVHALPFSFYRMMSCERGRGVHSNVEEGYTIMALDTAAQLLNATRPEMESLFRKYRRI